MKPIQLNMFIYGGAFDPMTVGHEGIIRNLVNYVQTLAHQETVYDLDGKEVPKAELDHIKEFATIVYVTNNDEKKYSIPLDNRLRIVEKVVGDLEPLTILPQTERMAATLKTLIADTIKGDGYPGLTEENININLVMGYDEWVSLKHREWVESDWLLNRCNFLVVDRPDVRSYGECNIRVTQSDIAIPVPKDSDLRVKYVNWKVPCVSSTEVRRAMKFNPLYDGKDVPIIVAMELGRLRLLGQDSQKEYDQFEETELKNYTPKKYPKLKRAEIATLKELPLGNRQLRMDLLVSPFTTDDSDEIPATFLFTISDYESGDLLAARIDEPGVKLQKFRDSLLTTFNEVIVRMGERPSAVHVEAYSLCDMLGDVVGKAEIELAHHLLPPLREAEMDAIYRRLEERGGRLSVSPGKIMF